MVTVVSYTCKLHPFEEDGGDIKCID